MAKDSLPPGWRPYRPSQGQPVELGQPDEAGRPGEADRPDEVGQQDEVGRPDEVGQPDQRDDEVEPVESAAPDEDTHWLLGPRPPVDEPPAYTPPPVQPSPPPSGQPPFGQPQPYPERPYPEQPSHGPPTGQFSPYGPPPHVGQPAGGRTSYGELSGDGTPQTRNPPSGPPPSGAQPAYGPTPHQHPPLGQPPPLGPPFALDSGGLTVSEAKKAGYLRWWALGMVVLIVILIVAALTGGDDQARTGSPPASTTGATTPQAGTPAPAPEATTAAPEPEPAPEAAAIEEYSGSGAQVVTLTATDARVLQLSHSGTANFVVWSVDAQGQDIDLVANTIGSYSGSHALNVFAREEAAALRIEADGEWTAVSAPLASAPSWDGTGTYSGEGSSVVLVAGAAEGLTPVTLTHQGSGNFAVWGYGAFPSLLVNDIGSYSGETLLPAGTQVLAVQADGPWTIARS